MNHLPVLSTAENVHMSARFGLAQKVRGHGAIDAVDELRELAAQEIAGVRGHQIQKRGLAQRVTKFLDGGNGIAVHRSITQSSRWCSSSTFAKRERSETETYMRNPACVLLRRWAGWYAAVTTSMSENAARPHSSNS